jgi:hypothetical protein
VCKTVRADSRRKRSSAGRGVDRGSTGKLAGLVLGGAGAVASWVLSGTDGEPIEFGDDEPTEREIEE